MHWSLVCVQESNRDKGITAQHGREMDGREEMDEMQMGWSPIYSQLTLCKYKWLLIANRPKNEGKFWWWTKQQLPLFLPLFPRQLFVASLARERSLASQYLTNLDHNPSSSCSQLLVMALGRQAKLVNYSRGPETVNAVSTLWERGFWYYIVGDRFLEDAIRYRVLVEIGFQRP